MYKKRFSSRKYRGNSRGYKKSSGKRISRVYVSRGGIRL